MTKLELLKRNIAKIEESKRPKIGEYTYKDGLKCKFLYSGIDDFHKKMDKFWMEDHSFIVSSDQCKPKRSMLSRLFSK